MKEVLVKSFWLIINLLLCDGELEGHLQQFGKHKLPTVRTAELHIVPQPREFFKNYVKPRIPVIFRGAALHSPATKRWSTDLLRKNHGDLVVRLEARAESSGFTPTTEIGYGRDTIRHFADNFESMNAYVISQIPQPMEKDVAIPPCLRCGNFAKSIQEVHLFLVGKGGKTLLHRDPYSNIHCVFNGTKDWILVDDVHHDDIYQSESSEDEFGGFSEIDVDKVDLEEFPDIQRVNFSKITLNGGDCIFMPASYWHQVRVNGKYNTAVSIWFSRHFANSQQDWSDCSEEEEYDFIPMSDVDILWRFSGKNESLTQGHMDIYVMRSVLLSMADNNEKISLESFCHKLTSYNEDKCREIIQKMKSVLNLSDDIINASVVRALPSGELKNLLLIFDPTDVSNTIDYEYSAIEEIDIKNLLDFTKGNSKILKSQFIEGYLLLGGSRTAADQIFTSLDEDSKGFVTPTNVENKFDIAVAKFRESSQHDPTTERLWLRHMRDRNEL